MTLGEYAQEFVDYLCKKLPDINTATAMEIAEFATMKACNYAYDEIKKYDDRWWRYTNRYEDYLSKIIKKEKQDGRN